MFDKKSLNATQFHPPGSYLCLVKRFFSILFAIYIVSVTCMPCSDGDACADENEIEVNLTLSDDHSEEEGDFCSPFCVCSCCNSHVNQPKYFSFSFETVESQTLYSAIGFNDIQRISYAIWQPPRLG